MWEVVGYNVRQAVCKDNVTRKFYDIYLQREAAAPAQGFEVAAGDYREDRYHYVPKIGDKVFAAFARSAQGRVFLADLQVVPNA